MHLEMNSLENPVLSMQNEGKSDSLIQEQHLGDSAFAAIANSSSTSDQKRILKDNFWQRMSSFWGIFDVSFPYTLHID